MTHELQFVWVKRTAKNGRVTGTFALNNQCCDGSPIDHRGIVVAGAELRSRIANARKQGILYHTWNKQAALWREQAIKGGFVELVNRMDDALNMPCLLDLIPSSQEAIVKVEKVEKVERTDDNIISQQLHSLAGGTVC
jgi:hypothetical protein